MQSLYIEATKSSPQINFNIETNILEIKGESYPENTTQFYQKMFEWLEDYMKSITNRHVVFNIELIYFNSSSSKVLMDLFDMLDELHVKGKNIEVNWIHDKENDASLEYGEEFAEDIEFLPFNLIEK